MHGQLTTLNSNFLAELTRRVQSVRLRLLGLSAMRSCQSYVIDSALALQWADEQTIGDLFERRALALTASTWQALGRPPLQAACWEMAGMRRCSRSTQTTPMRSSLRSVRSTNTKATRALPHAHTRDASTAAHSLTCAGAALSEASDTRVTAAARTAHSGL